MSFSSEQKLHIINSGIKSACCRRSLLSGIMFAKARVDADSILISLERPEYAEFVSSFVREFYGKKADIYRPEKGGRCINMRFGSHSAINYISNLESSDNLFMEKCASCASYFLRGVFLASGKISDPEKQYSIEFTLGDRADLFAQYLGGLGLSALVSDKRNGRTVYFKNSSQIEDLLGHANMNKALFDVIEARFNGEARKNIMRALNCETRNMEKTVNAAVSQHKLIERLEKANLLSSLPDELLAVARLRLEYPDYSLSRLAAEASMSKSGLSHRMTKLLEYGERLLEKR